MRLGWVRSPAFRRMDPGSERNHSTAVMPGTGEVPHRFDIGSQSRSPAASPAASIPACSHIPSAGSPTRPNPCSVPPLRILRALARFARPPPPPGLIQIKHLQVQSMLQELPSPVDLRRADRPPMNAYSRWAQLVVHTLSCPRDPKTLALWSQHVGVSTGTLRTRCVAAGVRVAAARDLSRLLRLVLLAQTADLPWDPPRHLEARDPRTIHRLLMRGGVADWPSGRPPPTLQQLLTRQRLVQDPALTALRQALASRLVVSGSP